MLGFVKNYLTAKNLKKAAMTVGTVAAGASLLAATYVALMVALTALIIVPTLIVPFAAIVVTSAVGAAVIVGGAAKLFPEKTTSVKASPERVATSSTPALQVQSPAAEFTSVAGSPNNAIVGASSTPTVKPPTAG